MIFSQLARRMVLREPGDESLHSGSPGPLCIPNSGISVRQMIK